jgi:hypothetical protein
MGPRRAHILAVVSRGSSSILPVVALAARAGTIISAVSELRRN